MEALLLLSTLTSLHASFPFDQGSASGEGRKTISSEDEQKQRQASSTSSAGIVSASVSTSSTEQLSVTSCARKEDTPPMEEESMSMGVNLSSSTGSPAEHMHMSLKTSSKEHQMHSMDMKHMEEGANVNSKGMKKDLKVALTLPALSLHHETHFADREDRKQVEEYAACLLARPLLVEPILGGDSAGAGIASSSPFRVESRAQVPLKLLENVVETFAVLVDCRLRAYATFLARHGITLAKKCESSLTGVIGMEQKVTTLLDTGKTIHARSMTLQCLPREDVEEVEESKVAGGDQDTVVPLTLQINMKIEITRPNGAVDLIPVNIAAVGVGRGTVSKTSTSEDDATTSTDTTASSSTNSIDISLDTRKLLEDMIHQASDVVAAVVEVANTSSILAESKLCRSSSFLAMPPPPKAKTTSNATLSIHQKRTIVSLTKLSGADDEEEAADVTTNTVEKNSASASAADQHPVVSPETGAVIASSINVPSLHLHDKEDGKQQREEHHAPQPPALMDDYDDYDHFAEVDAEEDLSGLTPEACADIVDGILGEWDDRICTSGSIIAGISDGESPSKKQRLVYLQ